MSIKAVINVTDGPSQGAQLEFTEGYITLGRGRCDLMLRDKKVSGEHCRLIIDGNHVLLEDLKSTNGTFYKGQKISRRVRLENLDEFVMGLSKISVSIVESLLDEPLENFAEEFPADDFPTQAEEPKQGENPVYRDTGIRRIEGLIDDEMISVSKWDHPEVKDLDHQSHILVPTIKIQLKKIKGPEGLTNFVCTNSITTIGRRGVDIKLNDLDCSRLHAQIEIIAGNTGFIKDLASTNGTFLNGKKISTEEIKTGDIIQVGQTFLQVMIEGND